MQKVAIVILNWNGSKMLEAYLPILIEYTKGQAAIFIVDNASTDNSVELLKGKFTDCKLILLDKNYGFAEGYNRALKEINYEYYLLLNSDIEVTENWLEPLVVFMDTHPDVSACQPKLRSIYEKDRFEYAGAAGGYIDKFGYPFCRGRIFDSVEKDYGQYDNLTEIHWATGACLLIRKKDFWSVGGFDARFFAHNEEIDLCWRLRLLGKKIFCVPKSYVYHLGGGTLPKTNSHKTYLNFRNNLLMLYKNTSQKRLGKIMIIRWMLDYVAAFLTLLLNKNYNDFIAIYKARKDFCKMKVDYKIDRERVQNSRVVKCSSMQTRYSILWNYYVKGIKKFSDLPK